jgi:hypothetical protein
MIIISELALEGKSDMDSREILQSGEILVRKVERMRFEHFQFDICRPLDRE